METSDEYRYTAHVVIASDHAGLSPVFKAFENEIYRVLARVEDPHDVIHGDLTAREPALHQHPGGQARAEVKVMQTSGSMNFAENRRYLHRLAEDSKMGALLGFIMGHYLGTKAGPERSEELRRAWQTIVNSEEFQDLLATGTAVLGSAVEQGCSMLFPQLKAMTAGNVQYG